MTGQKIALVTGATRGIGAAIAIRLKADGLNVIGTATSAAGAAAIEARGLIGKVLDVTQPDAGDALIEDIVKTYAGLHVLVNNAGITRDMLALRLKDEDWDCVLATNLRAVFRLSRSAMRPMLRQRFGRIINITSVVGAAGNPGQANYAAAKAGVAGMSRALAQELGARGVTVNCVAPGFIKTDMTEGLSQEQRNALLRTIALGTLGNPEDVAHAVSYLASEGAGYVTGQQLHVNGGMYMA